MDLIPVSWDAPGRRTQSHVHLNACRLDSTLSLSLPTVPVRIFMLCYHSLFSLFPFDLGIVVTICGPSCLGPRPLISDFFELATSIISAV